MSRGIKNCQIRGEFFVQKVLWFNSFQCFSNFTVVSAIHFNFNIQQISTFNDRKVHIASQA